LVPISAPRSNYNLNADFVSCVGGSQEFRGRLNKTAGNRIFHDLLDKTATEYKNIGKGKDSTSRKTELRVKLVNDFHEYTNGGRLFRYTGNGVLTQLSAEQLLCAETNNNFIGECI